MKNRIIDFFRNELKYTIFFVIILVVTLGIATATYQYTDFSLQLPFETLYGSLVYAVVLGSGIIAYLIFSKKFYNKMKLENLYLLIAIPIGIMYCIANPLGKVPDEDFHARKSVAISQGNFLSTADEEGNALEKENIKIPIVVDRTTSSYKEYWEKINIEQTNETANVEYNTMALYSPICHLPQAIGISIVRIFTEDIVAQLYGGRIVNMLFSIIMIYFSIKLIPFKKIIVVFLGLLPITMNEIASLSSDAITIVMCFFFISYVLYLKYKDTNKYTKPELIILGISTIIVALVKIVYIPLCLLLFILPKEKFNSTKAKNIILISLVICAILLNLIWLIYCSRFLVEFNPGVNSGEQVKYVLTHPITYIIMFRTIVVYFQNFVVCLNGEGLGHYNAQASVFYVLSSIILFAFLFFVKDKEKYDEIKIDLTTKIISSVIFLITIVLIFTSIYVQWNKVSYQLVLGIQGRYFLPILLLTAIILDNNYFLVKEKISKRYIFIFMLFFNLNALANIVFTYMSGHPIEYLIK